MDGVQKQLVGITSALVAWFAPVQPLICCALVFVTVDFATGVAASRKRAKRSQEPWGFESSKAWKTIHKTVFILGGIMLSWLIDLYILPFANLNLANIFTGFVCGVEFWSYLENAAEISEHPIFRHLKKIMKTRLKKEYDI